MPGLVGIVQKHTAKQVDQGLFRRMVAALHHRPWYRVDTYLASEVAIARVHLNILNPAPQPHAGKSGRVKVFLHGEIYNDEAGEANQLEYIASAYERFGLDFAAQLNGSFVVLLMDEVTDTLIIATDRTASKPVFYYLEDSFLYFAPEPKALLLAPSLPRRLNLSAIASFLACGYYLNGQALFENIRPLDRATVLTVSPAGVATYKYWHYTFDEESKDRGSAYYQDALYQLIRQAVRRRIRSQHRYGILLSGGYDSRGILGCYLAERGQEPVTTISWGVAEEIPQSDCAVAKQLAHDLGLPHTFYPLRMAGFPKHLRNFVSVHDGLTDACTNYPESLNIFSQIRTELGVQVILRGDECFGFSSPACNERTVFDKFGIMSLERSRLYKKILKDSWLSYFSELMPALIKELSRKCNAKNIYLRQNFFYVDQRVQYYINPLNYVKSIEVEVRTPYFDNDILDFIRGLPAHYHFGKRFYRNLLQSRFPDLFKETAKRANLPNLHAESENKGLNTFLIKNICAEDSPLMQYFNADAILLLLNDFFSTMYHERDNKIAKTAGRLLRSWPFVYNILYKMYLPIQDNQNLDPIPLPTMLLRILTLNLYLESIR